jgi:hypothetical protein
MATDPGAESEHELRPPEPGDSGDEFKLPTFDGGGFPDGFPFDSGRRMIEFLEDEDDTTLPRSGRLPN